MFGGKDNGIEELSPDLFFAECTYFMLYLGICMGNEYVLPCGCRGDGKYFVGE